MAAVGPAPRDLSICLPVERPAPEQYSSVLPVHVRPSALPDPPIRSGAQQEMLHSLPILTPCSGQGAHRRHEPAPSPPLESPPQWHDQIRPEGVVRQRPDRVERRRHPSTFCHPQCRCCLYTDSGERARLGNRRKLASSARIGRNVPTRSAAHVRCSVASFGAATRHP